VSSPSSVLYAKWNAILPSRTGVTSRRNYSHVCMTTSSSLGIWRLVILLIVTLVGDRIVPYLRQVKWVPPKSHPTGVFPYKTTPNLFQIIACCPKRSNCLYHYEDCYETSKTHMTFGVIHVRTPRLHNSQHIL
jgi:hypothetical protein